MTGEWNPVFSETRPAPRPSCQPAAVGFAGPAWLTLTLTLAVLTGPAAPAQAQGIIPGLPPAPAPTAPPDAATPTKEKEGGTTVATTSGPIKVDAPVDDQAVRETLENLLPRYPGVRTIDATVDQGVVQLEGQVDDDDTRDRMTEVVGKVEGVRLVINRLRTDDEVLTAPELVLRKLRGFWEVVSRRWLLAVLAVGIVLAFAGLARLFNAWSETLLSPFIRNVMLRSVLGPVIGGLIGVAGVLFGLSVLNLTRIVVSVLGAASLVGLAVGFAFKDITENFIASVLLGLRRPFRVGDYVTVAGQTGVVKSLNTRATVLVTLEGRHVRIPNSVMYKEILSNATASPSYRASFDVVIPFQASTAAALEAMTGALHEIREILPEPPARALVEALEPGGVRLRAYYWVPVRDVDWFKLNSDAKLRAKVALQQAGALPVGPAAVTPGPALEHARADGSPAARAEAKAEANLRKDARAAEKASGAPEEGCATPMQHVLNEAETRVSDEGTNLLAQASP
jgi:small-conductance mechanosensitive channel